jgi:hypothetical protein
VRGEIARAAFYMDVRYSGDKANENDLQLTNDLSAISSDSVFFGNLDTLLEWHIADPVDAAERVRNDLVHSDYQKNRNPFVDHPVGNYAGFVKSCLRGIAAGLCVSYNMLANDLEGVNYSSIRAGLLDEREYYKAVQRWFTDTVITPVFEGWLETNILNGTINLPAAKLDKFNAPDWKPRRWAWVDPLKDQQASILAVENHLKSKRQVISESGGDIEDVFRDIKKDEELAEDVGLEKPSESVA